MAHSQRSAPPLRTSATIGNLTESQAPLPDELLEGTQFIGRRRSPVEKADANTAQGLCRLQVSGDFGGARLGAPWLAIGEHVVRFTLFQRVSRCV